MSINISKQQRDELIRKISEVKTFLSQNANRPELIRYMSELENEVKGVKYGLVYEEHREKIDDIMDTHTVVFEEKEDLFIDNGGSLNFLIEGDNLPALKLLLKTHKGKVDVVYIDPPYNTLSEGFTYSDKMIDKNDTFRHSKWLSFMEKRLEYAKKLLSLNGVLFISIDDNEVGALRLLCDKIFGYQNFVANVIWEKKYTLSNDAKWFSDNHDHILLYARNKERWVPNKLPRTEKMDKAYKNPDNHLKGVWKSTPLHAKSGVEGGERFTYIFKNGVVWSPPLGTYPRFSEDTLSRLDNNNEIWFGKNGTAVPSRKTFLSALSSEGVTARTIWKYDEVGHNHEANEELKKIFGYGGVFSNPKPVRLIQRVLQLASKSDSIVIDFFAGSGTTGQAVLAQNKEDGGNRKFILVTNNQNNICREVTYERIKRIIEKENYAASLKYYEVDFINIDKQLYYEYADNLLKHIKELVELENGIHFKNSSKIAILLTDEEVMEFLDNIVNHNKYIKLYLGHAVLLSGEQENILKQNNIKWIIIPDYYYGELRG